ncbi:MAG: nuclear transport factor 2 family protein, partial [Ilumatobacteraceae bacterium]
MTHDELVDRELIRDLVQRYARGVDRRDFDLVRSCYHPDAIDEHGPFRGDVDGFIVFLREQLARWSVTQHVIGNSLIEFDG